MAFSNFTVGLPLLLGAAGRPVALASTLLATETCATALGALLARFLSTRPRGGPNRLVLSLALVTAGGVVLACIAWTPALFLGAGVVGCGVGMFWVASQGIMGVYAGTAGSERAFLRHYGSFTAGGIVGSVVTGVLAIQLEGLGVDPGTAARFTLGLGATAVAVGWVFWSPRHLPGARPGFMAPRLERRFLVCGMRMQTADLLLVAGMAMQVPLAPIVLVGAFELSTPAVGGVLAATGIAKVVGAVVARRLVGGFGSRGAVPGMLGTGGLMCLLLSLQTTPAVFVATLLVAVGATGGIWPVIVDAAQARTELDRRDHLAAGWNVREYAVISGMTAIGGWAYGTWDQTAPLFLLSALLILLALRAAVVVLRLPIVTPHLVAPSTAV